VSERDPDQVAAGAIRAVVTGSSALVLEVATLKAQLAQLDEHYTGRVLELANLCARAADAITEHCVDGFWDCNELLKELRDAAK